jgi:hypothetical protein
MIAQVTQLVPVVLGAGHLVEPNPPAVVQAELEVTVAELLELELLVKDTLVHLEYGLGIQVVEEVLLEPVQLIQQTAVLVSATQQ